MVLVLLSPVNISIALYFFIWILLAIWYSCPFLFQILFIEIIQILLFQIYIWNLKYSIFDFTPHFRLLRKNNVLQSSPFYAFVSYRFIILVSFIYFIGKLIKWPHKFICQRNLMVCIFNLIILTFFLIQKSVTLWWYRSLIILINFILVELEISWRNNDLQSFIFF